MILSIVMLSNDTLSNDSLITLGLLMLSITKLSIMTLSIMTLRRTNATQHNELFAFNDETILSISAFSITILIITIKIATMCNVVLLAGVQYYEAQHNNTMATLCNIVMLSVIVLRAITLSAVFAKWCIFNFMHGVFMLTVIKLSGHHDNQHYNKDTILCIKSLPCWVLRWVPRHSHSIMTLTL